ncbi:MAG: helix-turn-helix domain-containing protein [Streptococcus sp.]
MYARNTINYRMTKVKELLNCQLDTFEEKCHIC